MKPLCELNDRQREWFDAMMARGHMPIVDEDGVLDFFAYAKGYHNGPGCQVCGWSACWHCHDLSNIPACTAALEQPK